MKDNFSSHAPDYARYRPHYPHELVSYLVGLAPAHRLAWDCATGNGQVAEMLSEYFAQVIGTDISQNQLNSAVQRSNITYKVEQAEASSLESASVDLVVVAQAIHWFNFGRFYREVARVVRPGGIVAVVGYGLLKTDPAIENIILKLYRDTLGKYWDTERSYLDEAYETIPFPFEELEAPHFKMTADWSLDELTGYLNTWSAAKHFEKEQGQNPISLIEQELRQSWGGQKKMQVTFDLLLRIGRI